MPFIAFEGLDGSGKSTLMNLLETQLKKNQKTVVRTREPGGTPLGEELREIILRTSGESPTPRAELLLYQAIRAQHVDQKIRPALEKKQWVLTDRFSASSVAFQAGGRSISENDVVWLNQFSTNDLQPDLTVLLDLSVEKSEARRQQREHSTGIQSDRIENEKREFHQRVRDSFLRQAKQQAQSWLVLDAEKPTEELFQLVWSELEGRAWLSSLL